MAKRFMYVCLGILALAAAFHLGAKYGQAESIVDHATAGIVGFHSDHVLMDNGEVWLLYEGTWQNLGAPPGGVSAQPTTWSKIKAEFRE